MKDRVLALDLGTTCGWAVINNDGSGIDAGIWDLSGNRFEGGGMRFLRFRGFLSEALEHVGRVAYEEVRRHQGTSAAHIYGGMMAILTEECERRGMPYEAIPVGTIKKFATGKGNANKELMIEAAREAAPHLVIKDDNMADAIHIARCAVAP